MRPFKVPTLDEVSEQDKQIFDDLESKLDFVPNIYATYAYSDQSTIQVGRYSERL